MTIDDAAFEAHFLPAEQRAVLDRFAVHGPHLQAEMSGEATAVDGGNAVKFGLQVGPSAVVDVLRLWPSFINAEARVWSIEHIHGGDVVSGSMKADWDAAAFNEAMHKRAVPPDSVRGDFSLHDAVVIELLPGIPALTGLDAVGFLTGRVFSVAAKHGVMEFAQGRRMQGTDIFFKVPDTSPAFIVPAIGGAHVTGGADALADLLSRDSIKKFAGFSVDPSTVKGQFQGNLGLDLGLGKNAHPDNQKFKVEASLSNFSLDKYIGNERFEQGALDVAADSGNVKITGQGLFNTVPTKVELTKAGARRRRPQPDDDTRRCRARAARAQRRPADDRTDGGAPEGAAEQIRRRRRCGSRQGRDSKPGGRYRQAGGQARQGDVHAEIWARRLCDRRDRAGCRRGHGARDRASRPRRRLSDRQPLAVAPLSRRRPQARPAERPGDEGGGAEGPRSTRATWSRRFSATIRPPAASRTSTSTPRSAPSWVRTNARSTSSNFWRPVAGASFEPCSRGDNSGTA